MSVTYTKGNGADGALTISTSVTENSVLSNIASGASSAQANITVASATGFSNNDMCLVIQMVGTGAGNYEFLKISSISVNTITFFTNLVNTYQATGAQVIKVKQYTSVTINSGGTWAPANAWNGTIGGILCALIQGDFVQNAGGAMNADGMGFAGGPAHTFSGGSGSNQGSQGNSSTGTGSVSSSPNGMGGGGGTLTGIPTVSGGGGGGYGTAGADGATGGTPVGQGASTSGTANLSTMFLGGGGGSGGNCCDPSTSGGGGVGGGMIFIIANNITFNGGTVSVTGGNGGLGTGNFTGAGGGGSGGAIRLLAGGTLTLGSGIVTATGGTGPSNGSNAKGGDGGQGRIGTLSTTTVSGTSSPSIDTSSTDVITSTPSVSDSITVTPVVLSLVTSAQFFPSVSSAITVSESVTMRIGTLAFSDFLGGFVTSNYKWLTSTLLTAQQNYNVQPFFRCVVLDDTVQPNQIIKDGSSGANTQQPSSLGSAVTAPDGNIIAAGFDASNHISFFKGSNLHNAGTWDQQTTLDSSASILTPHSGQARVAISCSEYINGTYHIDVYYFKNFVNDGTDLQIIQQYSDDGGTTWNSRTFNLGVANSAYYASSPILNLSCCAFKPRINSAGLLQSGFAFNRPNGNVFTQNPLQAQQGYDLYYVTGTPSGFSSNIKWSQRNANSNDWIIHSLDSYYLNGIDYIVISGFRNFIDPPNTLGTNYSIWLTAGLVLSGATANDIWMYPRAIFTANSVTVVNQNSFTYPVATVVNGVVHIVFRAVTVLTVSQSGASTAVVTTQVNYMKVHSYDGINFSYPTIIVSATGVEFNDANTAQNYNSYTNQGVYYYLLGSGLLWEFIKNNTQADVSNDVVQYSIQESAGQPASINLQIANQNNIWVGSAPTNPGASAIAKNRKILLHQGFINANGVAEVTPRNTFFIDDITQNVSSNSNNVILTGRDFYKKLKNTVTKYAFGYTGPFYYVDIFDGSTLANWSQISGSWSETVNTMQISSAPATDAVILLNGASNLSYGSLTSVNLKRVTTGANQGSNHIYAMYIDTNNWLRAEIGDSTWAVVRNVAGSKTTLDSGACVASGSNTFPFIIKRYDYFKFCFLQGSTGTNNAIDTFNSVTLLANGTTGEYDMTTQILAYAPQPFGVGFGCIGGTNAGTFSFFKHIQFDNSNSLSDLLNALGSKSDIKKYDIQNTLVDNFYIKSNYTGTFTNLNNRLTITAGNAALITSNASQVANGEFVFQAKLTPTNSGSAYGFQFAFRTNGNSSPSAAYYWHVIASSSGGYIHSRFERLYSGTTYIIPAQASDATVNPGSTIGNLNFDLTAIHTYRIVMVDGWMFAFIDGIMVNAWNDNNTTIAYLTSGYWGWQADSNTTVTVYNMQSTAFWKQIQQFSLNAGDDVESSLLSIIQSVRAWVFSNLFGTFKALFLSSADPSTYTYQNQIFAQGVDDSDKEYISQVTVYGDGVSAVARNTTLMAGAAVKEEVIVDYTIKTQQDATARANNELTNNNQYQNQYNPKQTMNVGAELFDSVTIVDTGNNTTGVNSGSRVYAEKFTAGGSNGGNEYSVELDTGNL